MKVDLTKQDIEILIQIISQVNCPIDQGQILLMIRNKLTGVINKNGTIG